MAPQDFRLVRQDGPCSGTFVSTQNNNGAALGPQRTAWDLEAAAANCRQLDCGTALSTHTELDVERLGSASDTSTFRAAPVVQKIRCSGASLILSQ